MARRKSADPTASDFGFVYVMSDGPRSRAKQYKIGFSGCVEERRKKLSAQTAASEELYVVMQWLCPSSEDAQKIEKRVKDKLASEGLGIRKRREFFQCDNLLTIKKWVEDAANNLNCKIYLSVEPNACSVAKSLNHMHTIPHDVLQCLPREQRAAYFQGARDALKLIALMGAVTEPVESVSVYALGSISEDLETNRDIDIADQTPSLTGTILGHFRNGADPQVQKAADNAIDIVRLNEQEELHQYT
jgi:hypothetical protein